ncbi:hypothetical protein [Iningainema tapete]|uniref:Uncharacterized protein n=1 Tax=Iningainema tapete BLCC-T55 TaxID=2748662 RepID=A0A8J6XJR6_9CYAN|nr:hypothetical protein [Iningainema tapete]MBD2777309.1 hypothetical protein [Iningainema tapete BLCC-T55]
MTRRVNARRPQLGEMSITTFFIQDVTAIARTLTLASVNSNIINNLN